jgi:hypothetical protein
LFDEEKVHAQRDTPAPKMPRKVPKNTAVSWDQPLHHQLDQVPVIRQVADVPGNQRLVDPNRMLDRAYATGGRTMRFEPPPGARFEGDGAPGSTVGSDEPSKRNAQMKFGSSLSLYENYPPVWSPAGRKAHCTSPSPARAGGAAAAAGVQSPTRGGGAAFPGGGRYSPPKCGGGGGGGGGGVNSGNNDVNGSEFRGLSRATRERGAADPLAFPASPGRALSNGFPLQGLGLVNQVPITPIHARTAAAAAAAAAARGSSPLPPHEQIAARLDLRARGPKFALREEPLAQYSASLAHVPDVSGEAHAERAERGGYQLATLEAAADAFHRRAQWGSGAAEQDAQAIALSAFASVHPIKSGGDRQPPACAYTFPRDTQKPNEASPSTYVPPYIITTPGPGHYNCDDSVTAARRSRGWTRGHCRTLSRAGAASEAGGHWEGGRWVVPRAHNSPGKRRPKRGGGAVSQFAQTALSSPARSSASPGGGAGGAEPPGFGVTFAAQSRAGGDGDAAVATAGAEIALTTTLSALDRARTYSARHTSRKEAARASAAEARARRDQEAEAKEESEGFFKELSDFEAHFAKISTGSHVVV